jgi:hypothetical protein
LHIARTFIQIMDSNSNPNFGANPGSNGRPGNSYAPETAGNSSTSNTVNVQGNLAIARAHQQTQETEARRRQEQDAAFRAEQRIKELIQQQQQHQLPQQAHSVTSSMNAPSYAGVAASHHVMPGTGASSLNHNNAMQMQSQITAQMQQQPPPPRNASSAFQGHTRHTGNAEASAIHKGMQFASANQNQVKERSATQQNAANHPTSTSKHPGPTVTDKPVPQPPQASAAREEHVNGNSNANKSAPATPEKLPVVDLGENVANCPHPIAKPDDPPDSFVVVELPSGVVAGDRIQISIPTSIDNGNAFKSKNAASRSTDEEKGKERKIAFIVPHTYTATPEGNGFIIVNTSINKRPRLIMPDPSNIPSASEVGASHKTSPRKTPLHVSHTEQGQPKASATTERHCSRVGAKFQVAYLPPCKGSDDFQSQMKPLGSDTRKRSSFLTQCELRSEDLWYVLCMCLKLTVSSRDRIKEFILHLVHSLMS